MTFIKFQATHYIVKNGFLLYFVELFSKDQRAKSPKLVELHIGVEQPAINKTASFIKNDEHDPCKLNFCYQSLHSDRFAPTRECPLLRHFETTNSCQSD